MSLSVKNVSKSYGDKLVLENLSFQIGHPGVYALLGTNGAGKTTAMRIILGILTKNSGEVLYHDKPLDAISMNVGYLAEERGLYPKYSLLDQLLYFAKLRKVPKQIALERIKYWSERLLVDEYVFPKQIKGKKAPKSNLTDTLSKGNQQKVQLMSTLIAEPELLILDEPLSGLDPVNTDLFKSIIREEIDKGKFIIMSSHQMVTIEEFCSDITVLNRGRTVLQGNLNEIKKSYGRVNLFLKSDEDIASDISESGLFIEKKTPGEYHLKVKGETEAMNFLEKLIHAKRPIVKFELREPSLHEIFVEKVGSESESE